MNKKIIQKLCVTSYIIFGCFLASLVFSHKTNALEMVVNVDYTGKSWVVSNLNCVYSDGVTKSISGGNCSLPYPGWSSSTGSVAFTAGLTQIRTTDTYPAKKGYYYKAILSLKSDVGEPSLIWNMDTTSGWVFSSIKELSSDTAEQEIFIDCRTTGQTQYACLEALGYQGTIQDSKYSRFYEIVLQAKQDGQISWSFGNGSRKIIDTKQGTIGNIYVGLFNIQELMPVDSISEAEQKTEDATNEGDSNSQSSESQNQQASQTIISTMGQVFGAFSTSASNCNLDMDLGNADFGTINLCSGKPAAISAILTPIGTIVMVYAIFLCSRSIFRLFVKISTFAQGGSSNG